MEPGLVVIRENRYFLPQDDRTGINRGRDVVDRRAGSRQSPPQRVSHGPRTPQRREATVAGQHLNISAVGEERGVDVDDLPREPFKKLRGENQHPAGKDDQIGFEGTKYFSQPAVIGLAHDRVAAIGKR
jgi:hypothetical protein